MMPTPNNLVKELLLDRVNYIVLTKPGSIKTTVNKQLLERYTNIFKNSFKIFTAFFFFFLIENQSMIILKHLAERERLKGEKKIPHNLSTQKIATANMVVYYIPDKRFCTKTHTFFSFKYS